MILDDIVADKKIRLAEHKKRIDLQAMRRLAEQQEATDRSFYENLKKPGISIIGEFKKATRWTLTEPYFQVRPCSLSSPYLQSWADAPLSSSQANQPWPT